MTLESAIDKYSADGMRLALADAGDGIEDANFVEKMADAGILRLYTWIEWVKEIINGEVELRDEAPSTFHDRVFISEMNKAIKETRVHYENMLYKEAVKAGFFEFQLSRDKYRELCNCMGGMNKELIYRFIEIQTILLAPVCPHVCEHVWGLLGKTESIMFAKWPTAGDIDFTMIRASNYLTNTAHDLRLRQKARLNQSSKKKQAVQQPLPTHCIVYVAKNYPEWQRVTIETLRQGYESNGGSAPENKLIAQKLKQEPAVKKFMKKVMPFVATLKELVTKTGITNALALTSPFDEQSVLESNLAYLVDTLELEGIEVRCSTSGNTKVQEDCCPGHPLCEFVTKPAVEVTAMNQQRFSGHFTIKVPVRDADDSAKVVSRIRKLCRIKDSTEVKLYRFADPIVGSRTIPNFDDILAGKVEIDSTSTFTVDTANNTVFVKDGDKSTDIGGVLTYWLVQ